MRLCRFKNQQPKIISLLIQKSTAKNFTVADSEMINRKIAVFPI
jgi:hypothetical protein